jgi:hypothetical protein
MFLSVTELRAMPACNQRIQIPFLHSSGGQLYAGQPAYQTVKEINGNEVQMDPEKTRGFPVHLLGHRDGLVATEALAHIDHTTSVPREGTIMELPTKCQQLRKGFSECK